MKPENLLHAITDIDEDILLDAKNHTHHRFFSKRRLAALVTAAVLASTLVGTCLASVDGAGWFRNFFAAQSGTPLTEGKNAYLSQSATAFQQSYTTDGYTISLESALSDGVNTIIQFRVDVPEGTVLDAHHYAINNWKDFELVSHNGETLRDSGGWDSYDEDPNDNMFSLLYVTENNWYEKDIDRIFGTTWTIRIDGIKSRYMENLYTDDFRYWDEVLVTGPWEFEITIPESGNRELQFIAEPVSCPATRTRPLNLADRDENGQISPDYFQDEVIVTSLRLRALSFAIDFQLSNGEKGNADFAPFTIVMKDGTQVLVGVNHTNLLGVVGSGAPGFTSFNLGSPVVLEEVDYILLPDGTKLVPVS